MLVSVIEVAASEWRLNQADGDREVLFRELEPKWAERLERSGDPNLVGDMAKEWSRLLRATDKFIKFFLAHAPDPPPARPRPVDCVDWTATGLRAILKKVYDHRSSALHGGIPFPTPMCIPPLVLQVEGVPMEKPWSEIMKIPSAVWTAADLPIHLHALPIWCEVRS
jgi:hypothetical protein